jgi:hypothetical protein
MKCIEKTSKAVSSQLATLGVENTVKLFFEKILKNRASSSWKISCENEPFFRIPNHFLRSESELGSRKGP